MDFDAALTIVYSLEVKLNNMVELLRVGKEGEVSVVEIGNIKFNAGQLTTLEDKYNSLKSSLKTIALTLP